MLVLTRKSEEKIVIGKNQKIVITVLKIQGDKVSIGIEADKDTPIYRSELLLKERDREKNASKNTIQNHAIPVGELSKNLQKEMLENVEDEEAEISLETIKE